MDKEYKYFTHKDNDVVICTHPLVKKVSVVRNFEAPAHPSMPSGYRDYPQCELHLSIRS